MSQPSFVVLGVSIVVSLIPTIIVGVRIGQASVFAKVKRLTVVRTDIVGTNLLNSVLITLLAFFPIYAILPNFMEKYGVAWAIAWTALLTLIGHITSMISGIVVVYNQRDCSSFGAIADWLYGREAFRDFMKIRSNQQKEGVPRASDIEAFRWNYGISYFALKDTYGKILDLEEKHDQ